MIGVFTPIKVDAALYSLAVRDCTLGSLAASYSIVGTANVADYSIENVTPTNTTLGLADGLGGGAGTARVSGAGNYGLSINRMAAADAIIDGRLRSYSKPLVRFRETNYDLFLHNSTTPQKHDVQYVTTNPNSGNACGTKQVTEFAHFASAGAAVNIAAFAMPDLTLAIVKLTVLQWHSTDPTKYGYWERKRKVYKNGGAITFLGTLDNIITPEDTDGSFTAPTLVDDGSGNVAAHVFSHPTQASRALATLDIMLVRS